MADLTYGRGTYEQFGEYLELINLVFGYTNTEWHYVFAASTLATLPLLAFFQVLEKHLMGGLTAGGVKG